MFTFPLLRSSLVPGANAVECRRSGGDVVGPGDGRWVETLEGFDVVPGGAAVEGFLQLVDGVGKGIPFDLCSAGVNGDGIDAGVG